MTRVAEAPLVTAGNSVSACDDAAVRENLALFHDKRGGDEYGDHADR